MRFIIPDYSGEYRVLSIALDEEVKSDLLNEDVEFLYIYEESAYIYPEKTLLTDDSDLIDKLRQCNNYDVIEIMEDGLTVRCYDNSSNENVFFITEKCNSNCIMCPSPEQSRRRGNTTDINDLIRIASHVPSNVSHITITGGEPFMVGKDLFKLLDYCKNKFYSTEFQLLTNGRIFALDEYVEELRESLPDICCIGIPIHGSNSDIHDSITGVTGSFQQTLSGIIKVQSIGIDTEIRIVVCKNNVFDLENIAKLICEKLSAAKFVSIMAMEMTGNAFKNRNEVWIPYKESFKYVRKAVNVLINDGIDVRLYNYPLCTVDSDMRTLCYKSISGWKIRFDEKCDNCVIKESCGGVFAGTYNMIKDELEAVV